MGLRSRLRLGRVRQEEMLGLIIGNLWRVIDCISRGSVSKLGDIGLNELTNIRILPVLLFDFVVICVGFALRLGGSLDFSD